MGLAPRGLTADESTKRPLAGYAMFNEHYVSYDNGDYKAQISNFVHEVLHALYFEPDHFKNFPANQAGESFLFQDAKGVYKLRGDSILAQIRSHFACSSADGGTRAAPLIQAPLENNGDGGIGGHFEKLVFGDETMVSDDSMDARFSAMSLALAKDSGWFEVDLAMGENYFWGKGEGCSIFEHSCSTDSVSEFCSVEGHSGCSDNHLYRTQCDQSNLTGDCRIFLNVQSCKVAHKPESVFFEYGPDSLCLDTEVG